MALGLNAAELTVERERRITSDLNATVTGRRHFNRIVRRFRSTMGDAIRFVAKDVSLDPQVGFVGFADQEGQRYFWMQPGEMTTAKDEIWLERDDQAWGGCGGAWNIVLTRDKFIVNTRQLPWMACDAIEIEFAVDDATYARLKELLQQVMIGCRSDLDIRD